MRVGSFWNLGRIIVDLGSVVGLLDSTVIRLRFWFILELFFVNFSGFRFVRF